MNAAEAALLCRYVAACCPQQRFDEFTPDAWFDLLGDLPLDLAKRAAAEVAKRQPFVAPSEIRSTLHAMRGNIRTAIAQAIEERARWWDPEGDESFTAWQRRRNSIAAGMVDDALRSGIIPESQELDEGGDTERVGALVASIVRDMPQLESW